MQIKGQNDTPSQEIDTETKETVFKKDISFEHSKQDRTPRATRYKSCLEVTISLLRFIIFTKEKLRAETTNISATGVKVLLTSLIEADTKVEITIKHVDLKKKLTFLGKIVRAKQLLLNNNYKVYDTGIAFIKPSGRKTRMLEKWISEAPSIPG